MLIKQLVIFILLAFSSLYPVVKEKKIITIFKNAPITNIDFSSNANLIACASYTSGEIKVLDVSSRKIKHKVLFEKKIINSLVFYKQDTLLVGRTDGILEKVGLYKGNNVQVFKLFKTGPVQLAWSKDKSYVVVGHGTDYSARISFEQGECRQDMIQRKSYFSRSDVWDDFTHRKNGYSIFANSLDISSRYSIWNSIVIFDKEEIVESFSKGFGITSLAWHPVEPHLLLGMPDGSLLRRIILKKVRVYRPYLYYQQSDNFYK